GEHYVRNVGVEGSNPFCSTFQSPDFWRCQRIAQNRRVCARFSIARGPGERLGRRKSAESAKSYPGAILLGPWIIAVNSPAGRTASNTHERCFFLHPASSKQH